MDALVLLCRIELRVSRDSVVFLTLLAKLHGLGLAPPGFSDAARSSYFYKLAAERSASSVRDLSRCLLVPSRSAARKLYAHQVPTAAGDP